MVTAVRHRRLGLVHCAPAVGDGQAEQPREVVPYYRCKFPAEYAIASGEHNRTVYVREGSVVPGLDEWLAGLFDDEHLDATCAALAEASQLPDDNHEVVELDLRRRLKDCQTKLARYRDVLESGTEVSVVGDWIAEVDRERRSIERQLGHKPTNQVLTTSEVKALVTRLKDILAVLAHADPELKRTVYEELGVPFHLPPQWRGPRRSGRPACTRRSCRRGDLNPHALAGTSPSS